MSLEGSGWDGGQGMKRCHHRDRTCLQEEETELSFPKWISSGRADLLCPSQSKGKENYRKTAGQEEASGLLGSQND